MFPPSMLARLFVKGSLKNIPTGFEFKLKNIIDSASLVGLGPLVVDETTYPADQVKIRVGEKETLGSQISGSAPLYVRSFLELAVVVDGVALPAGDHKITVQVLTREAGRLQFSVTEALAE